MWLSDGLAAVEAATLRCQQLTERLRELTEGWRLAPLVKALQAMRGVEFVTAVTLAAEVGDFRRFAKATDFMGYVGLVPSEQTTGAHRRQGPITKTGNAHVRHVLVESAWHYRRPAADEQGAARAERGGVAAGLRDRVEGAEAAAQPAAAVDRPREEPRRGGDGGGAGAGGIRLGDQPGVPLLGVIGRPSTWDGIDLSLRCQSRRIGKGGIVPPPFGLGPRDGARVVSPRSPILRPGHQTS